MPEVMSFAFLAVLLRIAALLLAGFAGFCLLLYWRQEGMLFLPERAPLTTVSREAGAVGFRLWPEASSAYRALLAEPTGPIHGTCVVWHGNAGSARQRDYLAAPLLQLGLRVVVVEYPGYGARPRGSLREAALVAEARELVAEVRRHFDGTVIVVGESLGAAMAAAVAGDPALPIAGVVLITPWHDLAAVARVHYPWLPIGLLLRDHFDNSAALQSYRGPVVVVTAAADEIIPAAEGRRLYQALPTPAKRLHEIPGAYHNDWVERVTPGVWRTWLSFITAGK
jgi:alpha-beta hydrolase superfamily lysophospholipase